MQSFIFDFRKSPTFFQKWNKEFDVEDIGSNCFYLVLVDDICADNIDDVLTEDGQISYSNTHLLKKQCFLEYTQIDNDHSEITLDGEVEITLANPFNMKGAFLTNDAGYVMGYSINTSSLQISEAIIFEDGLRFWTMGECNNGE